MEKNSELIESCINAFVLMPLFLSLSVTAQELLSTESQLQVSATLERYAQIISTCVTFVDNTLQTIPCLFVCSSALGSTLRRE